MGYLCDAFGVGCNFLEYLEVGQVHPETGQNLFVGIHADGKGATLLTEIPADASTGGDWEARAETLNAQISAQIQEPVQEAFCAYKQFIDSSPELTDAASRLDILTPDYADVFYTDKTADLISRMAAEKSLSAGSDEASAVYGGIANDMSVLGEKMASVMEGPEYSALITIDHALANAGFEPQAIRDINIGASDAGVTGLDPCELAAGIPVPPQ